MTKRSRPQRLGPVGEAAFRLFCANNLLTANKVEEDFGIDFFCQVDKAPSFSATGQIGGVVVAASVRGSTGRDARIRLTRDDASVLLRAQFPVVVALIDERDRMRPVVYHRFLDAAFALDLLAFLDSSRTTVSFTPKQFQDESAFAAALAVATAEGQLEALRLQVAQSRLASTLGDATVEVHRTARGQFTFVTAVHLFRYFDDADEASRRAIYLATFGALGRQHERIAALAIREGIIRELDRLPAPYIVAGFSLADEVAVTVSGSWGTASCVFERTGNDTHLGYVHHGGFAITISHRIERDGQWVHILDTLPDPDVELDLEDHPNLAAFLACCERDAELTIDGLATTFTVSDFGGLPAIGKFAKAIAVARALPGWQAGLFHLCDVATEEPVATLSWLAWMHDCVQRGRPFLEIGDQASGSVERPALIEVPSVANAPEVGLLIRLSGRGVAFLEGDYAVALRIDLPESCTISLVERIPKATRFPEIVMNPSARTMAVSPDGLTETATDASNWHLGVTWSLDSDRR